jgi:DNA polymerase-3 subunit beta
MKISLLQENLQRVLQDLQKLVPSRPQLPILSCIYIEASETEVLFSVTDLQVGIRSKVPAKVLEAGKAAIPAKIFIDLVTNLEAGEIVLTLEGLSLQVSSKDSKVQIQTFPPEDYPAFPVKEGQELSIPYSFFGPAVQSTAFAASSEDSRPILTAVLMSLGEKLEMVATDGFRLARIVLPFSAEPLQLLLPARALMEVVRIAGRKEAENVVFSVSEKLKQAFFSFEDVEILVRVMEGDFPPYQKIIPAEFTTQLSFDAGEFTQKLKVANIFARESSGIIKLKVEKESLKLISASSTLGNQESSLPISLEEGGEKEIAFNTKYLQEFLSVLKPEKVWMGMNESLKPAVFRPEGMENYQYIAMPFRVTS